MAADLKNPFDDLGPYGVEYKKKNVRRGRAQEPQPRPEPTPESGLRPTPQPALPEETTPEGAELPPLQMEPQQPAKDPNRSLENALRNSVPANIELEPVGPDAAPKPNTPYGDIGPFGPRVEGNPLFRNPFSDGKKHKARSTGPTTEQILSPFVIKKEALRSPVTLVVTIIVALLWLFVKLPAINPRYPGLYGTIVFLCLIYLIVMFVVHGFDFKASYKKDYWSFLFKHCKVALIILVAALVVFLAAHISSWPVLRWEPLSEQLTVTVAEQEPASDGPAVDAATARRAAEALLSGREMGDPALCIGPAGPVWMLYPTENEVTGCCVAVDAVTGEAALVQPEGLTYERPGHKLDLLLRLRHPTWVFADPVLELDDSGAPYWIAARTRNSVGLMRGAAVLGVLTVDAVTGEDVYYPLDRIPDWVDHVYPAELIREHFYNYALYKDGYRNPENTKSGLPVLTTATPVSVLRDGQVMLRAQVTDSERIPNPMGTLQADFRTEETIVYLSNR